MIPVADLTQQRYSQCDHLKRAKNVGIHFGREQLW